MKKSSRRKFVKQAAVAVAAAGTLKAMSVGKAAEKLESETVDVLYRETSEWKRYYETLR